MGIYDRAQERAVIAGEQTQMGQNKVSHHSSSAEGWDTTIIKAPDSHRHSKHRRKHRKPWVKVLVGILICLLVILVGVAIAAFLYVNSLNSAMSLGDQKEKVEATLVAPEKNEPFYVLVMGVDMREGTLAGEEAHGSDGDVKSDTIMLLRVDVDNSKISLLTVPRDYPYTFEDGVTRKLNSAYVLGGAEGVINAVSDLMGVKISHYVEVSGTDLVEMVDNLGGITVDVPITFDWTNIDGAQIHLDEGLQHVDGEQALALASMRLRYEGKNRDVKRQSAARAVVQGIMDAILARPALEVPGAVADAASCVKTDMTVDEIADLARKMGANATLYTGTGPNDGAIDPYVEWDPPVEGSHPWLCYVNDAGWERVIDAFVKGKDISEISYADDVVHYAGQPEDTWSEGPVKPKNSEK